MADQISLNTNEKGNSINQISIKDNKKNLDAQTGSKNNSLTSGQTNKGKSVKIHPNTKNQSNSRVKKLNFKKRLAHFVSSKIFDFVIILLIILYTLLVVALLIIDDYTSAYPWLRKTIIAFIYVEIGILIVFSIEILLKCYAFGLKKYFKDLWMVFDAIIIVLSIVLAALDLLEIDLNSYNVISKVVRGLFRLMRIFLLFRKFAMIKKIQKTYSKYDIKTNIEKVIEILENNMSELDDKLLIDDLDWVVHMISTNKLYDVSDTKYAKSGDEYTNFINSYSGNTKVISNDKRISTAANPNSATRKSAYHIQLKELHIPENLKIAFKDIDNLSFNVFEVYEKNAENNLVFLLQYIFDREQLFENLAISSNSLYCFIHKIQEGYLKNPYHNKIHAFDVCQTTNFFLTKCKFAELANISYIEKAAMYISAAIHDFEHPGLNNVFLINDRNYLAIRYNDKSVLENHHVARAFSVIFTEKSCNIFKDFTKDEFISIRGKIISMVLATDMSSHFSDLAMMKGRLATAEFDMADKDKAMCMNSIIHAADISNPIKNYDVYSRWVDRVLKEYWDQGDLEREKGYPISYLCDKYTTNTAKSQIGFINVIVKPTYEVLKSFLPELSTYIANLDANQKRWEDQVAIYDRKLAELKEKDEVKNQ